jgi:elongation factor Ts
VSHYGTALLELNCETDFVAEDARLRRAGPAAGRVRPRRTTSPTRPRSRWRSCPTASRWRTPIQEYSAKIGEKIVLNRFVDLDSANGTVAVYLHRKAQDLPPQVGVLVQYTGKTDEAGDADARGIGMQIAAMRPRFLTRDEVPAEVVDSERRIAEETAKEEGKPEKALPKIVEGRVNSFFKDYVLLEQSSVVDNKKTVKQIADEAGLTITRFVRFEVGQE